MELPASLGVSMHSTAMCWAAAEGNLETVRRLREEHGADVNACDYDKRTPLHIAVSDGQIEIVNYLLRCGANAEALDRWGRSSIDCAIETKNVAILRLLERATYGRSNTVSLFEVDKRMRATSESEGLRRSRSSPDIASFFRAIQEGNTEKLKRAWLDGMEVNIADHLGRTSLHIAVETGQIGVIELLLSAGVNTTVVDNLGRSPISIALEKQYIAIVDILRNHQKTKFSSHEVKSSENADEIAHAFRVTKRGEIEKLKQLVPAIVRPDMDDYDRRTLLHIASAEGHVEIVKYLVDCGANVNLLDRWGSSPLSDAMDFAHNDVAKFLSANHATESGFRATVAVDHIDSTTLTGALEYTLRVITRGPWIMGQGHCPMLDEDNNCILMTHSIWQKNSRIDPHSSTLQYSAGIQKYRKVSSMVMLDPGQGLIGSVFSSQHPQWLDLRTSHQSQFFLLPHARVAGFQTSLAIPMICKMSTVAVLSWYSLHALSEDQHEVQRMQRLVRSVMILSSLRQDYSSSMNSNGHNGRISRFQFCQTLDNAITANGELTDTSIQREDLDVCDTIPLALEWKLFDLIDTLATSMNSEDHAAIVPILRSLVFLLHNGLFDQALHQQSRHLSLKHVIETANGKIRTKSDLIGHLKYYLQYFYTVSPTEAELFTEVQELSLRVEKALNARTPDDKKSTFDSTLTNEMESQENEARVERIDKTECVLCKYKVPGHIHPGLAPIPADLQPRERILSVSKTSHLMHGKKFFGQADNPRSPVYRHIEQLLERLENEYDAFKRKIELAKCCDGSQTTVITSSDLYDVIGAAHEPLKIDGYASRNYSRKDLLDVMNEIMHDTSCIISQKQLVALHERLLSTSSGQAGVFRTDLAVGYASSRIYRVFLPAEEINDAIEIYIKRLNDETRWTQRPLLRAYYAFAVLVFYIHPFHDGNGRCARLIGNLVAKKLGYPFLLRASDKTIQLVEFLEKAIVTVEILRSSRRQTRALAAYT
ncbi:FOG: Ankyrin repeat [Plasmopara halstedii]|uniref:FOG: Ankyrin repeat n=1 Tax=Plasmopara halstedii TaxID=4781 RepID=A0A0P1B4Z7_PLAHL|nr:FOG: Ankyrin repeat [Plasmopara halstedii]CEG49486.1 FOG: Ankyrin repeat [Plasmopara halstedii]|eukprot:XP_024585855.1 FOG: Ankyrin repeat [Plasmopara halstedii]